MFHDDLAGAQIEERLQGRLAALLGPARARLVGRAIAIHDEVQLRPVDLKVAQRDMRSEQAEDAHPDAQTVDLGVRRFAGILRAMDDDSAGFSLESEKPPMKRRNLSAAAGDILNLCDEALANQILKRSGAGNEIGGNRREDEQDRGRCERKRQVAKEEAAQTTYACRAGEARAEAADPGRLKWGGDRSFSLTWART